jgi:multimeric flavodoxin WrbA
MSALIDRAGMTGLVNDSMFARKVGASIVVARRGGAMQTFNTLNSFFFIQQMVVPGSRYWNMGFGREKGEVLSDEEGMQTMDVLGENMAWLMHKLND